MSTQGDSCCILIYNFLLAFVVVGLVFQIHHLGYATLAKMLLSKNAIEKIQKEIEDKDSSIFLRKRHLSAYTHKLLVQHINNCCY